MLTVPVRPVAATYEGQSFPALSSLLDPRVLRQFHTLRYIAASSPTPPIEILHADGL